MALPIERESHVKESGEGEQDISPLTIERKEVVTPIPSQFKAQVIDDADKPLIKTQQNQTLTITLPDTPAALVEVGHGSVDDSLTWFGVYWLRMFKKAVLLGWDWLVGKK